MLALHLCHTHCFLLLMGVQGTPSVNPSPTPPKSGRATGKVQLIGRTCSRVGASAINHTPDLAGDRCRTDGMIIVFSLFTWVLLNA